MTDEEMKQKALTALDAYFILQPAEAHAAIHAATEAGLYNHETVRELGGRLLELPKGGNYTNLDVVLTLQAILGYICEETMKMTDELYDQVASGKTAQA